MSKQVSKELHSTLELVKSILGETAGALEETAIALEEAVENFERIAFTYKLQPIPVETRQGHKTRYLTLVK